MAVGVYAMTTLAAAKAYLPDLSGTTHDTLIESLIDALSARAESYCRRLFVKRTHTETLDGTGEYLLNLSYWPIISVTTITEDDIALTLDTDYEIVAATGQLHHLNGAWSLVESRNVTVTYVAGYAFPSIGLVAFTGSGLNDATSGGSYTGTADATFTIIIDTTGTPDKFKWRKDSGSWTTGVAITGTAQTLSDGVTITFGATTGHTLADQWTIAAVSRTLPYDLEDAIKRQVAKEFGDIRHKAAGRSSQSMPDGSVSLDTPAEWLPEVRATLDRYREVACG